MSNESPPGNDSSHIQKTGRGRGIIVATNSSPTLGLPQHRYCRAGSDQESKGDGPTGKFCNNNFVPRNLYLLNL